MTVLFLDAETRSECDIKKAGAAKYVRDPSTHPLIWTWAFDEEPVESWDVPLDQPIPEHFTEALEDPSITKIAFNAPFDRGIVTENMGIDSPIEQWRDAMVLAYSLGFKGTLDDVLEQIGFREGKIKEGKQLINLFSSPNPKNWKLRWSDHTTHPEKWQRFVEYAVQDTAVLRQLWNWCASYESIGDAQWREWFLDQKINNRGVPVDTGLCRSARKLQDRAKLETKERLQEITGLPNPLSNQQMRGWLLKERGVQVTSLAKDVVPHLPVDEPTREVLNLYLQGNAKAASKYDRFLQMTGKDGRVRDMFQFVGAGRTGRWAGRGVQLHNLKRGPRFDEQPELILLEDRWTLEAIYGDLLETLSESVRAAVTATEGHQLVVADLSAIESRVVAWLTLCQPMLDVFAEGRDPYKDLATAIFHVPYDEVTKEQRTFSKPAVLGGVYMLSGAGLHRYAADMGIDIERKEAFRHVRVFRKEKYPQIPVFWEWIAWAVEEVMATGRVVEGYRLRIELVGSFLRIWMPSDRGLWYYKPRMQMRKIRYEDEEGNLREMEKLSFTYDGFDQDRYKWGRISTHAGGLTENLVQAMARDVLAKHIQWADAQGVTVIGHVHDEIIAEEPAEMAEYQLEHLNRIMSISPSWAPDLPVGAAGYISRRYKKD